jgi:hypothetical protein
MRAKYAELEVCAAAAAVADSCCCCTTAVISVHVLHNCVAAAALACFQGSASLAVASLRRSHGTGSTPTSSAAAAALYCCCIQDLVSRCDVVTINIHCCCCCCCCLPCLTQDLVSRCDVVTINIPLHASTRGLFNKQLMSKMKKGSYLVNTARGEWGPCLAAGLVLLGFRGYGLH